MVSIDVSFSLWFCIIIQRKLFKIKFVQYVKLEWRLHRVRLLRSMSERAEVSCR